MLITPVNIYSVGLDSEMGFILMKKTKVFQHNDQEILQLDNGCCSNFTVFLLKGIASVLEFSFLGPYRTYDYHRYWQWFGTSDSFGMLMIAKSRKKRSENGLGKKRLFWRKRAQNTQSKGCLRNFYYEDSFCFFRVFFLVTYIRENWFFCVWWSTFLLLLVWCIFIRKLRPKRLLKYWSVKRDHPDNNYIEMCFAAIEWEHCIFAKRFNGR